MKYLKVRIIKSKREGFVVEKHESLTMNLDGIIVIIENRSSEKVTVF